MLCSCQVSQIALIANMKSCKHWALCTLIDFLIINKPHNEGTNLA